jgi:hypothetical protein
MLSVMERTPVIDHAPPEPPADSGGGGGWAWLLTAKGIIEAELVRGVLETAGIVPVALDSRDQSPGAWMFLSGNVNALVRVFVPVSLLDAARLTLLEVGLTDTDAPAESEARPKATRSRSLWLLAILATACVIAIFLFATMRGRVG